MATDPVAELRLAKVAPSSVRPPRPAPKPREPIKLPKLPFKVRPIWPLTIASLAIALGWVARGVQLETPVPAAPAPVVPAPPDRTVRSLVDVERGLEAGGTWRKLAAVGRAYASPSGVLVRFDAHQGVPRMRIVVDDDEAHAREAFLLLALVCLLGDDDQQVDSNASRVDAWMVAPTGILSLHGSTVAISAQGSQLTFEVVENL